MSDDEFRRRYFQALGLTETPLEDTPHSRALDRAHELRRFEIENYWKRATYIWGFQVASFTFLGFVLSRSPTHPLPREAFLLPASLGAITAFSGWLTALGSKFWQENWEAHVDMLEQDREGRLTQTILTKGPVRFSVSRVNEFLLGYLSFGWLVAFAIVLFPSIESFWFSRLPGWARQAVPSAVLVAAGALMLCKARSKLTGMVATAEQDWKRRPKQSEEPDSRSIIWRDSAAGRADPGR